eukprot:CAMPEP_0119283206 /NCGR_PEP_ID=MMETSP1329-20130426/28113_1 /TAXON_ID=114041 /ORGANISM="Genus nov. species nov., Strain RCC1024" /LENGTH=332 /DNA_ID=CAMNT_0007283873 /DNA_START=148 /DNA_END=1143 /DNA_ORIENTATION=+
MRATLLVAVLALALANAVVFRQTRTLPCARPDAAKTLFLDETWKRGRYGLPLPPPIDIGNGARLVIPPGLVEGLEDDSDDAVTYRVRNPGWLSLYPVTAHQGRVLFEEKDGQTRMTWTVEYEPEASRIAELWTGFLTKIIVTSACDELVKIASGENEPSVLERFVIRRLLDWFRDSELVEEQHAAHVAAPAVTHLLKGTPFVDAPDDQKVSFSNSYVGRLVARVVKEEGEYLRDWKVEKILEAAGEYDAAAAAEDLRAEAAKAPIVMFSFEDCPWCVAAKELLEADYAGQYVDVALEPLGVRGKALRAAVADATGRTSMPAVFVRGEAIGGY